MYAYSRHFSRALAAPGGLTVAQAPNNEPCPSLVPLQYCCWLWEDLLLPQIPLLMWPHKAQYRSKYPALISVSPPQLHPLPIKISWNRYCTRGNVVVDFQGIANMFETSAVSGYQLSVFGRNCLCEPNQRCFP